MTLSGPVRLERTKMTLKLITLTVVAVIIAASIAFIYRAKTETAVLQQEALPALELSTTTTNVTPGVTL